MKVEVEEEEVVLKYDGYRLRPFKCPICYGDVWRIERTEVGLCLSCRKQFKVTLEEL